MGKYNDLYMTAPEMTEIAMLIDALSDFGSGTSQVSIDHVQVGDTNGEILGKIQYTDGGWRFHARKHDKPGILGE